MVGTTPTPAATPGRSAVLRHQLLHSTHHPPTPPPPPPLPHPPPSLFTPTTPLGLRPPTQLNITLQPYEHCFKAAHPIYHHSFTPHQHSPCSGEMLGYSFFPYLRAPKQSLKPFLHGDEWH